jgi:hypothetical protein
MESPPKANWFLNRNTSELSDRQKVGYDFFISNRFYMRTLIFALFLLAYGVFAPPPVV